MLGTNFSEILIEIHTFSFKKIHLKLFVKWKPFCLGLNELTMPTKKVYNPALHVILEQFAVMFLLWVYFVADWNTTVLL